MQIKIECRFQRSIEELTDLIREHRRENDKSLDSFLRASQDAAKEIGCNCYFRLENAPEGGFQTVVVFL